LVNIFRRLVLFVVDLLLFTGRQLAAVGLAVRGDLLVDALLLVLELCRFAGRQLPALDALCDAVLLVFAALAHFRVAIVRRIGVVFVGVDLLREVVLLLVDLGLSRCRQLAAVGLAVCFGFAVDGCFFSFQFRGFTGGQLSALHAIGDAVLLIFFPLRDAGIRLLRRCRL